MEPLELVFTVDCSPEHAFDGVGAADTLWWPHGALVSGRPGAGGDVRAAPGGRIYERTPGGRGARLGRGRRLGAAAPAASTCGICAQDRGDATEVEITFAAPRAAAPGVTIVHRGWERLGSRGDGRRERNRRGWGEPVAPALPRRAAEPKQNQMPLDKGI